MGERLLLLVGAVFVLVGFGLFTLIVIIHP